MLSYEQLHGLVLNSTRTHHAENFNRIFRVGENKQLLIAFLAVAQDSENLTLI